MGVRENKIYTGGIHKVLERKTVWSSRIAQVTYMGPYKASERIIYIYGLHEMTPRSSV